MTLSLPSKEIYALDIPNAKEFDVKFVYNFFQKDESVVGFSLSDDVLKKLESDTLDYSLSKIITSKIPRYVDLSWNNISNKNDLNAINDLSLKDNLDKIIDEDYFSYENFYAVSFQDGAIDTKIYEFASGSFSILDITNNVIQKNDVSPDFVSMTSSTKNAYDGMSYYDNTNSSAKVLKKDMFFESLKKVSINTQISSKLFNVLTEHNINNPKSPFANDLKPLAKFSGKISKNAKSLIANRISDRDYKRVVPYARIQINRTSINQKTTTKVIGYVIDKYEVTNDNELVKLPPIIIEGANISHTIDSDIKFGKTYVYTIKAVMQFSITAADIDSSDIATIDILVSSAPSTKIFIEAIEKVAPPPPCEIDFTWNYDTEKMMISWSFPTNPQRDIKRFQVFRREKLEHPFELLKEYNFDNSEVKYESTEEPNQRLVEFMDSAWLNYIDDDFTKNSSYIYTVCSIDAHGFTSSYGEQFRLSFDKFKNELVKSIVSHSGAPKSYPNMYIPGEAMVDVARISGSASKNLKLYFVPQYYKLENDDKSQYDILQTNTMNGSYKFQFINTDNQKSDIVTVNINDLTTLS